MAEEAISTTTHCVDCKHPEKLELDYNLYNADTGELVHVFKKPGTFTPVKNSRGEVVNHPGTGMLCKKEGRRKKEGGL